MIIIKGHVKNKSLQAINCTGADKLPGTKSVLAPIRMQHMQQSNTLCAIQVTQPINAVRDLCILLDHELTMKQRVNLMTDV